MSASGVLRLKPITFTPDDEIEDWGNEKLDILLKQYGETQTHKWKDNGGKVTVVESDPLVDSERARREWSAFKRTVKREMYARPTTAVLIKQIREFHDEFPDMLKLAKLAVTLPVHTADV